MKNGNGEPQTEAEVIAGWFNEQEVKQWMHARESLYGIKGLVLRMSTDKAIPCSANVGLDFEFGETFDKAVTKLKKAVPNPISLRAQANLLLKQAAEMESEGESNRTEELRTEGKKSQIKTNFHD